jgi:hypothetical protein
MSRTFLGDQNLTKESSYTSIIIVVAVVVVVVVKVVVVIVVVVVVVISLQHCLNGREQSAPFVQAIIHLKRMLHTYVDTCVVHRETNT